MASGGSSSSSSSSLFSHPSTSNTSSGIPISAGRHSPAPLSQPLGGSISAPSPSSSTTAPITPTLSSAYSSASAAPSTQFGAVIEFTDSGSRRHFLAATSGQLTLGGQPFSFCIQDDSTSSTNTTTGSSSSSTVKDLSLSPTSGPVSRTSHHSHFLPAASCCSNSKLILTLSLGVDHVAPAELELNYQNRLLVQLRTALCNSRKELDSVSHSDENADLSRLGAMVLEQKRIEAELKKVESQSEIQYNAVQRTKKFEIHSNHASVIEGVCLLWAPTVPASGVNEIKETAWATVTRVAKNPVGNATATASGTATPPTATGVAVTAAGPNNTSSNTNNSTPAAVTNSAAEEEFIFLHRPMNIPPKGFCNFKWSAFSIRQPQNSTLQLGADAYAVTHIGAAAHACVSALPALSTSEKSFWQLKLKTINSATATASGSGTGTGNNSTNTNTNTTTNTNNTTNTTNNSDRTSTHWIGIGIQSTATASNYYSYGESGTLMVGTHSQGGVSNTMNASASNPAVFHRQLSDGDILSFAFDPIAKTLGIYINTISQSNGTVFQLANSGPFFIHANLYNQNDSLEFI